MMKMTMKMVFVGIASMIPFAVPMSAWAETEIHGGVTAGVGSVDLNTDSAKFGEYNGLDDGGYFIGGFNVSTE